MNTGFYLKYLKFNEGYQVLFGREYLELIVAVPTRNVREISTYIVLVTKNTETAM